MNYKVSYVLRWFDKRTEKFAGEERLDHVPLDRLTAIVKPDTEDPLIYNSYLVDESKAKSLGDHVSVVFDLARFDYFVECDRLDD